MDNGGQERRAESGERRAESGERRAALRRAPLPPAIYWQTRFRLFLKTVLWRATLATQRATNIYTASGCTPNYRGQGIKRPFFSLHYGVK